MTQFRLSMMAMFAISLLLSACDHGTNIEMLQLKYARHAARALGAELSKISLETSIGKLELQGEELWAPMESTLNIIRSDGQYLQLEDLRLYIAGMIFPDEALASYSSSAQSKKVSTSKPRLLVCLYFENRIVEVLLYDTNEICIVRNLELLDANVDN